MLLRTVIFALIFSYSYLTCACAIYYCPNETHACLDYFNPCENDTKSIHSKNSLLKNALLLVNEKYSLNPDLKSEEVNNFAFYNPIDDQNPDEMEKKLNWFSTIMNENHIEQNEQVLYLDWRKNLLKVTQLEDIRPPAKLTENIAAKNFILGIVSFYQSKYEDAFLKFKSVQEYSKNNQLKKTQEYIHYLMIRTASLKAQEKWDGYSTSSSKIDLTWSLKSIELNREFSELFPQSEFLESNLNLERRLVLLSGKKAEYFKLLSRDLNRLMQHQSDYDPRSFAMEIYFLALEFSNHLEAEDHISTNDIHPFFLPLFATIKISILNEKPQTAKEIKLNEYLKNIEEYQVKNEDWVLAKALLLFELNKKDELYQFTQSYSFTNYSFVTLHAFGLIYHGDFEAARKELLKIKNDRLYYLSFYFEDKIENAFFKDHYLKITKDNVEDFSKEILKALDLKRLKVFLENTKISPLLKKILEPHFIRKSILTRDFKTLAQYKTNTSLKKHVKYAQFILNHSKSLEESFLLMKYLGTSPIYAYEYRNCDKNNLKKDFSYLDEGQVPPIETLIEIETNLKKNKTYRFEPQLLYTLVRCFRATNDRNCFLGLNDVVDHESQIKTYPIELRKSWYTRLKTFYKNSREAKLLKYFY
jgi:hypothetical protein